jgi:hypothetical protein
MDLLCLYSGGRTTDNVANEPSIFG